MRGVRVGLSNLDDDPSNPLAKVGALKSCTWRLVGTVEEWDEAKEHDESSMTGTDEGSRIVVDNGGRGVCIQVIYERAEYSAVLLRRSPEDLSIIGDDARGPRDLPGFTAYPVLASRMPGSLRNTLVRYLEESFDTRASTLTLSTFFLVNTLDSFLDRIFRGLGEVGGERVVRDVLVTLAFAPLPPSAGGEGKERKDEDGDLKSIDITISKDDVSQFLVRGRKAVAAQQRAGDNGAEGRDKRIGGAFWLALGLYAKTHMAMGINHPDVRVAKIACGAFVLGREGRMKVFEPGQVRGGEDRENEAQEAAWNEAVEVVIESVVSTAGRGVLG